MEMNIDKRFIYKVLVLFLCVYLALMPAFSYKKVHAALSDKFYNFLRISTTLIIGLQSVGFIGDTTLTPENLENIYNKADTYLHENFGTELEYAEALRQVDQLGLDIASGKIFIPGNYSGKLWYSFLNAVVDVVWPVEITNVPQSEIFVGSIGKYYVTKKVNSSYAQYGIPNHGWSKYLYDVNSYTNNPSKKAESSNTAGYFYVRERGYESYSPNYTYYVMTLTNNPSGFYYFMMPSTVQWNKYLASVLGLPGDFSQVDNVLFVPSIKNKTANKVKLPTRLPQTVINNINNYYNGDTENLTIAPTPEELPTLPDGYNPNTDDLINLPGYEDVTPDQEPSGDPEPTPTPTPPEPTPEYNGDRWVNPIGDFMDGLLKFMKAAFVPTLSLNLDALNSMPDNLSEKFPFSLPGDLVRLFSVFQAEPVPFAFDWEIDFTPVGAGKIPIKGDLSMFDEYAPLFRNLAFIAFIIGLAWKTFGMFFGGGDE